MRRADRLFEIVQQMRGDRMVTAEKLAEHLEVSVRTIYRDVRDLQTAGVPIDGAAGVGYILRPGFQLPPLMFTLAEIEALVVGARMVESWAGRSLSRAAAEALIKIAAVVPPERMRTAGKVAIFAPPYFRFNDGMRARFDLAARAVEEKRKLSFRYRNADGEETERTVRPLALHFWGGVWTLASWCELRVDFRTFRLDRTDELTVTDQHFPLEKGKTLEDYLGRVTREA